MTHEIAMLPVAAGGLTIATAWMRWGWGRLHRPLGIGDKAPDFEPLSASDGRTYSLTDLRGSSALVLIFTANRCPGAKAYEERLGALHRELSPAGVRILGVDSISSDLYPSETLEELVKARAARGIPYPVLRDADQRVARAFGALCTPQAFVIDHRMRLRYRGRIDDSFVAQETRQHYLRDAIHAVVQGGEPPVRETMPLGCAIDLVRAAPHARLPWWRRAHELSLSPSDRMHRG